MLSQHTGARIKLDIAVEDEASISNHCDGATVDLATFHVVFVEVFIVIGIETAPSDFIKSDQVTLSNQTWLRRIGIANEQFGNGNRATCEQGAIRTELGEAERFACLTRTQFNQMVPDALSIVNANFSNRCGR